MRSLLAAIMALTLTGCVSVSGSVADSLAAPRDDAGAPLEKGITVQVTNEAVIALAVPNAGSPHGVVTVSVGVATAVAGEKPLDALLATADSALYEAKRGGRNQVVTLD